MIVYLDILKFNVRNLNIVDIIIFSVLFSFSENDFFISTNIIILASLIIIKKNVIKNLYTKSLEPLLFVSGTNINYILLPNIIINNALFLSTNILMINIMQVGFTNLLKGFVILNTTICFSFISSYYFLNRFSLSSFLKKTLNSCFFYFTAMISTYNSHLFIYVTTIVFFTILYLNKNKTLTINDLHR